MMKLRRIEAVRFGALEGTALEGIGDGLTVVLGPNESGKSTYTALVRSVLFGFPMGRGKAGERFYRPVAGDRAGRLTFADETGEWAVFRTEGKFGGPVGVTALHGPERPALLDELLGEMKESTYRVVFGFGLDELDDIENGDDQHLKARLYAAGAGQGASPLDVRAGLEKEAAELFKPGGRVSTVNQLAAQIKDVRERIRTLETEAADFAGDQERADRMAGELEPLRVRRDETDVRLRAIERDLQRAEDLTGDVRSLTDRLSELDEDAAAQAAALAAAIPDERVAAVAIDLQALLDDYGAYRQHREAADAQVAAIEAARARLSGIGDLPEAAVDQAGARARADAWTTRRAQLDGEIRAAERRVDGAEALERELRAAPGAGAPTRSGSRWPAWAMLALGVSFGALGVLLEQWLAAALGAAVAVAGGLWAIVGRGAARTGADLTADAARAAADARAARADAEAARAQLRIQEGEWTAWLDATCLRARGDDPAAVRGLLDDLKARADIEVEIASHASVAARESDLANAWVERLRTLVSGFLPMAEDPSPADVPGVAGRAREALEQVRETTTRRDRAADALAAVEVERARTRERADERREALRQLADAHGVAPDETTAQLEALAARTATELAEVRDVVDARAEDLAALRGRLDAGGRDAEMALARQRMEGLTTRAGEAADRYVVTALAVKLIDKARERYERERQPEVTRIAGRVFSQMTGGRYAGIRVPLDGSGIAVVTPSGAHVPTSELSTGAAQQLYLALRVGFLASLDAGRSLPVLMDDVVVNYDDERRAGAAVAIAELVRSRQVVFFTCHEDTAETLAAAVPGAVRISLGRCDLRR